jgi:hypothetical protein
MFSCLPAAVFDAHACLGNLSNLNQKSPQTSRTRTQV